MFHAWSKVLDLAVISLQFEMIFAHRMFLDSVIAPLVCARNIAQLTYIGRNFQVTGRCRSPKRDTAAQAPSLCKFIPRLYKWTSDDGFGLTAELGHRECDVFSSCTAGETLVGTHFKQWSRLM